MGNSLRHSLVLAHLRAQRVVVIPPGNHIAQLRKIPDLRHLGKPERVFAVRWDAERELLVEATGDVQSRLRELGSMAPSAVVWEGPTLSEWHAPGQPGPVASDGPVAGDGPVANDGLLLSGPRARIESPPLPRSTRSIELDLLATPSAPSAPAAIEGRLIWNATGDGHKTPRRFFIKTDGTRQTISVPLVLRRLEQLQAPSLQCRIQFLAAEAQVRILAIRAIP